jgi:hypothetical protein
VQPNVTVSVDSKTPALKALLAALSPAGRKALHSRSVTRLHKLIKTHLIGLAASRHDTASRLGATPTGHLAKAAERMTRTHDSEGGAVNIFSPGFKRVFESFTVFPRVAKALTIPVNALSYGRRVSEVQAMIGHKIFRFPYGNVLVYREGDHIVDLYVLVKRAFIKQDRSLLPEDSLFQAEVKAGLLSGIQAALAKKQGAA